MASVSVEIESPIGIRYVTEVRFRPFPQFLDRRGALVSAFWRSPFTQYSIQPPRVELTDDERTKIAFAAHSRLGMDMENVEDYQEFERYLRTWIGEVTNNRVFGRLHTQRLGLRSFYFSAVLGMEYEGLTELIGQTFLQVHEFLSALDEVTMVDNSATLILKTSAYQAKITFGPISRQESKDKGWIRTEQALQKVPELAFAMDVDVYLQHEPQVNQRGEDIMDFIRTAHTAADEIATSLTSKLRASL